MYRPEPGADLPPVIIFKNLQISSMAPQPCQLNISSEDLVDDTLEKSLFFGQTFGAGVNLLQPSGA